MLFSGHLGPVTCLEFYEKSDSEKLLFSGSSDRTLKVWNPWSASRDDACLQTLKGHGNTITAVMLTIGKAVVSCSTDSTMRLWLKSSKGYKLAQTISLPGAYPTCIGVRFVEHSSLYVGQSQGSISVYECERDNNHYTLNNKVDYTLIKSFNNIHKLSIQHILMLNDQSLMLSLSYDNSIRVMEATTGRHVMSITNTHNVRFLDCDWDSGHSELYTIDALGYIAAWDLFNERCVKSEKIENVSSRIKVIDAGSALLIQSKLDIRVFKISRDVKFTELTGVHNDAVISVKSCDNLVYSASMDNSICLWDVYGLKVGGTFEQKSSEISSMTMAKGFIVTGCDDGVLRFLNPETGSNLYSLKVHSNTISTLSSVVLQQDEYIISSGYDGLVCVFLFEKGGNNSLCFEPPSLHKKFNALNEVLATCFITSYKQNCDAIATGDNSGVIKLWKFLDTSMICAIKSSSSAGITCFALDGVFLFSGGEDGIIRIWNVSLPMKEAYEIGNIYEAHCGPIYGLLYLQKKNSLVSCGADGHVRFWGIGDVGKSRENIDGSFCPASKIADLKQSQSLRCLGLHQNKRLLFGTNDRHVLICDLPNSVALRKSANQEGVE